MHGFRINGPVLTPISSRDAAWYPTGVIAIGNNGRILFVGDAADLSEELEALPQMNTTDLLIPGFIDLHAHLPQYDCRGKFGKTLMEWLETFILPEEERFAQEAVARDISRRFYSGLLQAGTTTAMVYSSVHKNATEIAFEEAERAGLRILLGKVQMDCNVSESLKETVSQSVIDTEELIQAWHRKTDRLLYVVTPRFAPSCTMELMKQCALLAEKYDTYIQTHINESQGEIDAVRQHFPNHASYADVYRDAGLLESKTILAHNIHATDTELAMCGEYNCAVAHCPDSNLFLGSGRFSIDRHEAAGIRFGLGSDVGAGTTLNMIAIMQSMSHVQQRSLHPFQPFYYATLGGAVSLGLDDQIGSLESGKKADIVAVSINLHFCGGKRIEQLKPLEIASALVYRAQPGDIASVWINGELLWSAAPQIE